ncbi:hypothetical protein B0H14DRAFT_2774074 [Mycena olivaceomarginata]|nr:hypothetical protein B0H14DRAFT_2774074 [Mycena olivaceomarginata]
MSSRGCWRGFRASFWIPLGMRHVPDTCLFRRTGIRDPAPDAGHIIEAIANSTASSSHAPAPFCIPLSPRRSSRKRAASTVHSEAPPSKIMSAESSSAPVIIPESGRRRGVSCMTIKCIPASSSLLSSLTNNAPCMAMQNLPRSVLFCTMPDIIVD